MRSFHSDPEEFCGTTREVSAEADRDPLVVTPKSVTTSLPAPAVILNDDLTVTEVAAPGLPLFSIFDKFGRVRSSFSDAEISSLNPEQQIAWAALVVTAENETAADAEMAAAMVGVNEAMRENNSTRETAAGMKAGFVDEVPLASDIAMLRVAGATPEERSAAQARVAAVQHRNRMAHHSRSEEIRLQETRRVARQSNGLPIPPEQVLAEAKAAAERSVVEAQADALIRISDQRLQAARTRLSAARDEQRAARKAIGNAVSEWGSMFAVPDHVSQVRIMMAQTQKNLQDIANGNVPAAPVPARKLHPIEIARAAMPKKHPQYAPPKRG